ncbi:RagB/SusD family nutrient uptake outer membrane protein [Sphingobacterium corticibacterium]|nr:RagB/SusD family nutrient uptake outer membrane protein [Sphingobacterium corticibacterium]
MMKTNIFLAIGIGLSTLGCTAYLDVKPDRQMMVPNSLAHAELLLNDYNTMNLAFSTLGEIGTDDYYLTDANWKSISVIDERNTHVWSDEPIVLTTQWMNPYKVVYQANQILEVLAALDENEQPQSRFKQSKGAALFFRGFAFHQLLNVFALAYDPATATELEGIPLRLDTDIGPSSGRASLEDSYVQVIADFREAVHLLPMAKMQDGLPWKASAHAALARVYLDMGRFEEAYKYADSCLTIHDGLMDFNELTLSASLPIARFNEEVLFAAMTPTIGAMGQSFAKIDSTLYRSYDDLDLRKQAFFRSNTGANLGTYAFKGSYNNATTGIFLGLTTSEMFLVRAEAACRLGHVNEALDDLNTLLHNRWESGEYVEETETDADRLLEKILLERRKELVFRGRRWADLKRLNLDSRFAKTLIRRVNGQEYTLPPNSPKYAVLIPEVVISESGIKQNKR